jgi:hypothetical protein
MKVSAYTVSAKPDIIRSSTSRRDWMDDAAGKNPYRCLPLSMANSWGWEILSSAKFTATWDGGQSADSVKVVVHEGTNPPASHFGDGTLTWHTGYVFKTEYPYGMYVTGAPNAPKPNVMPLSGIVETHWLSYTFTMNWKFIQPGSFTIDIGEPYCQIFPVDMNMFESVVPEIKTLADDEEFYELYWDWNISRQNYMNERSIPTTKESNPGHWQKHYFQGKYPAGKVHPQGAKCPVHKISDDAEVSTHRTKPNVPEFVDVQTAPFTTVPDYYQRTKTSTEKYRQYLNSIQKNTNPSTSAVERTPEEVAQRIEYYKQQLRSQIK